MASLSLFHGFSAACSPHNQLAVVATYSSDLFTSAYHYARSYLTSIPHPRAHENLERLFSRAKQDVGVPFQPTGDG